MIITSKGVILEKPPPSKLQTIRTTSTGIDIVELITRLFQEYGIHIPADKNTRYKKACWYLYQLQRLGSEQRYPQIEKDIEELKIVIYEEQQKKRAEL